MGELSPETNGIETVVVRFEVATIIATVENEEESKRKWLLIQDLTSYQL